MRKTSLPVGSPPSQETSTLTLTGECVCVWGGGGGMGGSRKMERRDQITKGVVKKKREVEERGKGGGRKEEGVSSVFSRVNVVACYHHNVPLLFLSPSSLPAGVTTTGVGTSRPGHSTRTWIVCWKQTSGMPVS